MTDLNPYEEGLAVDLAKAHQRAKAAEAKLAMAVKALVEIATDEHPLGWIAIAALAEIKLADMTGDQP